MQTDFGTKWWSRRSAHRNKWFIPFQFSLSIQKHWRDNFKSFYCSTEKKKVRNKIPQKLTKLTRLIFLSFYRVFRLVFQPTWFVCWKGDFVVLSLSILFLFNCFVMLFLDNIHTKDAHTRWVFHKHHNNKTFLFIGFFSRFWYVCVFLSIFLLQQENHMKTFRAQGTCLK